jgi:hypothetical protein
MPDEQEEQPFYRFKVKSANHFRDIALSPVNVSSLPMADSRILMDGLGMMTQLGVIPAEKAVG